MLFEFRLLRRSSESHNIIVSHTHTHTKLILVNASPKQNNLFFKGGEVINLNVEYSFKTFENEGNEKDSLEEQKYRGELDGFCLL